MNIWFLCFFLAIVSTKKGGKTSGGSHFLCRDLISILLTCFYFYYSHKGDGIQEKWIKRNKSEYLHFVKRLCIKILDTNE